MARPRKQTLDYYPKDCRYNSEMLALMDVYQNDARGVMDEIWMDAYQKPNGEIDCSNEIIQASLARRSFVSLERWREIVQAACSLEILDAEKWAQKILTSEGIKKRLKTVNDERERKRKNKGGVFSGENSGDTEDIPELKTDISKEGAGENTAGVSLSLSISNKNKGEEFQTPSKRYQLSAQAHVGVEKQLKLKFGDIERGRECIRFYEKHASDWLVGKVKTRPPNFDQLVTRMIREDCAALKNFFHPNNQNLKNRPERKIVNGN